MVKRFKLHDFLLESNCIEGIAGVEPSLIAAAETFLALPSITRQDMVAFVAIAQPNAVLRDRVGLNVYVGNHVPPPGCPEIATELQTIIDAANGYCDAPNAAYFVHHTYETLHPFTDGNGRSGRILWLWMMGGIERAPLGFLHHWYYQSLSNTRVPTTPPAHWRKPMGEMMERIARALFARDPHWGRDFTWANAPEDVRFRFREDARATLEVLRNPTPEMYEASEREWDGRMSYRTTGAWNAMISAAIMVDRMAATPTARPTLSWKRWIVSASHGLRRESSRSTPSSQKAGARGRENSDGRTTQRPNRRPRARTVPRQRARPRCACLERW